MSGSPLAEARRAPATESTPILIVGAGPFGLAASTYLTHLGLEHTLLGVPMGFWRENMPTEMVLRSDCEWHLDPLGEHTIHAFLETRGEAPGDVEPLTLAFYLEYADWFMSERRIEPRPGLVTSLDRSPASGRFSALLDTGETLTADVVLLAPGFGSFARVPGELSTILPEGRYEHTSTAIDFAGLAGRRVVIVGGRQSAFEWTALIAEAGAASVDLVYRHDTPRFEVADWSWVPPLVDRVIDDPTWYRRLPKREQDAIEDRLWTEGRRKLEPWLAERVGVASVDLHPGRSILDCREDEDGALYLGLDDGSGLGCDRVILATGYEVDMSRIPYLSAGLLRDMDTEEGHPVLDGSFQTSIPGLYVTSMPAARDFGPFWAFTVSARASAIVIGEAVARRTGGATPRPPEPESTGEPESIDNAGSAGEP
ncbi:MAG: FAD-dependent oxidoreductase [Gemmatimonadota bacterium]|nr:FAD-dependent oxidoreductase [Gemmatimonadota bacterium]